MIIISRNDPESHLMLKQLLNGSNKNYSIKKAFLNKIYITKCLGDERMILCDDPIAFIYARLFFYKNASHIRLWAFEIWEHQVPLNNLKNLIRFLIFYVASLISYFLCDSILIPSEKRKVYLSKKYSKCKIPSKSKIILNIPEFYSGRGCLEEKKERRFTKFRNKYQYLLIYAGSLQPGRLLEELVKKENIDKNIGIVICGSGIMESKIRFAEANNSNLLFLGNLDEPGLSYVYQNSDVGLLIYDNKLPNTRMCAPLKLWEYLYNDLIIIGNENDALKEEWSQYISGYFSNINDINTLINSISKKSNNVAIPKFDYTKAISL